MSPCQSVYARLKRGNDMRRRTSRAIVWVLGLGAALLVVGHVVGSAQQSAAPTTAAPSAIALTSAQDRQRQMDLLKITSFPPGATGSLASAFDEATATPYPTLPDPLVMKNGTKVTTPLQWKARRAEILADFEKDVLGRRPAVTPKVSWKVASTTNETNGGVAVVTKQLIGHVDNSAYPAIDVNIAVSLSTPADAKGPVPVIMQLITTGFGAPAPPPSTGFDPCALVNPPPPARAGGPGRAGGAPGARGPAGPTWQQQALAKGWGYAILNTATVQADAGCGLTAGIIGLVNKGQPRKMDDWGWLSAVAWGASRALDYFETDKAVDATRVGLEGHSRWGKATLVSMALDQRFAIAYISSSGEGGAKLHRRKYGETIENLTAANEYHWMAGNFMEYAGRWDRLPVDSHELIALCAPRPVFISGGKGPDLNPDGTIALRTEPAQPGGPAPAPGTVLNANDAWIDAKGSFLAAVGAGPVYRLLGKKDLGTTTFPPIETGLMDGDLAFRQHAGGHTDQPNWPTFFTFAEREFKTMDAVRVAAPAKAVAANTK